MGDIEEFPRTRPALVPPPEGPLVIPDEVAPAGGRPIRLSVVIPTYNESRNVGEALARLSQLLGRSLDDRYELIIVDDDSPDRTWDVAAGLIPRYANLRVMRRVGERGFSTAVIRGWQAARGELLAVIDGDLRQPAEVMPRLLDEIDRGADLAVATPKVEDGRVSRRSLLQRTLSRVARWLGPVLLPAVFGRVSDPMSGCFIVRRSAVADVALRPLGREIVIELVARCPIGRVAEVGDAPRESPAGESVTAWAQLEYLRHLVRLRLSGPGTKRFARFALVGCSGVVVDMALLFLLSDPLMLGLGLTRSKAIAAETAIVNNFLWNDAWTFDDLVGRRRSVGHKLRRLLKFNAICAIGLALNLILLNVQFNLLHMNRYLANAIAIAVVTAWNFWMNLKVSWHDTGAGPGAAATPSPDRTPIGATG